MTTVVNKIAQKGSADNTSPILESLMETNESGNKSGEENNTLSLEKETLDGNTKDSTPRTDEGEEKHSEERSQRRSPTPPPPLPANYVDIGTEQPRSKGSVGKQPDEKVVWDNEKKQILELHYYRQVLNPVKPMGWKVGQRRAPTDKEKEVMLHVAKENIKLDFIPTLFEMIFNKEQQVKAYVHMPRNSLNYITCVVPLTAKYQQAAGWMIKRDIESATTYHRGDNKKAVTLKTAEFITDCVKMDHIGSSLVFGFKTKELAEKWGSRGLPFKGTYLNFNANNRGTHSFNSGVAEQTFGFSLCSNGSGLTKEYVYALLTENLFCRVASIEFNFNVKHWNWGGMEITLKGKQMPAWLRGKRMINLNGVAIPIVPKGSAAPCFKCGLPGQKIASCPCRLNPTLRTQFTLALTEATQEACANRLNKYEQDIWDWKEMLAEACEITEEVSLPKELVAPAAPQGAGNTLFEKDIGEGNLIQKGECSVVTTSDGVKRASVLAAEETKDNGKGIGKKIPTKSGKKIPARVAACYGIANQEWTEAIRGVKPATSKATKASIATLKEELADLGANQFALLRTHEPETTFDDSSEEDDHDSDNDEMDTTIEGTREKGFSSGESEDGSEEEEIQIQYLPLHQRLPTATLIKRTRKETGKINDMALAEITAILAEAKYQSEFHTITSETTNAEICKELVQYPGDGLRVVLHDMSNPVELMETMGAKALAKVGMHWAAADILALAKANVAECTDEMLSLDTELMGIATYRGLQEGTLNIHTLMRTEQWWKYILPPGMHGLVSQLDPGDMLLHEDSSGMMYFVMSFLLSRYPRSIAGILPRGDHTGFLFQLDESQFQLGRKFAIMHPAFSQFAYLRTPEVRQIVSFFLENNFDAGMDLVSQHITSYDGTPTSISSIITDTSDAL